MILCQLRLASPTSFDTDTDWDAPVSEEDPVYYVSDVGYSHYKRYLKSFTPPVHSAQQEYGGFAKLGFGDLAIFTAWFDRVGLDPFLIRSLDVRIYYAASPGGTPAILLDGIAHLTSYNREAVTFTLYDKRADINMLIEGEDQDGETVLLPRAFGYVKFEAVQRLTDSDAGHYRYHNGYMPHPIAPYFSSVEDNGAGKARLVFLANHGISSSDTIHIHDTDHRYDGSHVVASATSLTVDLEADFIGTAAGYAAKDGAKHVYVYDDGVPIRAIDGGDYTFHLTSRPIGTVQVSGYGLCETLHDAFTLYSPQLGASPNPTGTDCPINFWATEQMSVYDFLNAIVAFFSRWAFIRSGTAHLLPPEGFIDSYQLGDNRRNSLSLTRPDPYSLVRTSKTTRQSGDNGVSEEVTEFISSGYGVAYGNEISLSCYANGDMDSVGDILADIEEELRRTWVSFDLPLTDSVPLLGDKVSALDETFPPSMLRTVDGVVRGVTYDLSAHTIRIKAASII